MSYSWLEKAHKDDNPKTEFFVINFLAALALCYLNTNLKQKPENIPFNLKKFLVTA
jgi:hypothetical protein